MISVDFLKRVPLFRDFRRDEMEEIAHNFQEREYKKNQVVFSAEEAGQYMYIVKFGEVKAVLNTSDGREVILAFHGEGETFGEVGLLDGRTTHASVVAKEDSRIVIIPRRNFEQLLIKNQKFMLSVFRSLCDKLRECWQSIHVLKSGDAEERIRFILKDLSKTEGVRKDGGTVIKMKLTHQELAEMVGVSRETVSRILSRMQQQGQIRMVSRKFCLSPHPCWKETT